MSKFKKLMRKSNLHQIKPKQNSRQNSLGKLWDMYLMQLGNRSTKRGKFQKKYILFMKTVNFQVSKIIRYELKSLNVLFYLNGEQLRPVIIQSTSYDCKKTNTRKMEYFN